MPTQREHVIVHLLAISILISYFILLAGYSFDISSDDALYFQRALTQFSVLEFSPHFPGYPGFVWLEQLIYAVSDHPESNVITSFIAAIILSLSVYLFIFQRIENKWFALFALIIFIQQGSLAESALNGLSDASALAFFSIYLCLCIGKQTTHTSISSGLLLAACLAIRPSYLPLVSAALFIHFLCERQVKMVLVQLAMIGLVGLVCATFVFFHDGWAYFEEAQRFTQGHFSIWGNTAQESGSKLQQWFTAFSEFNSITANAVLLISLYCGLFVRCTRYLTCIFILWLSWIIYGQNPANIRHIAVLSLLSPLIFTLLLNTLIQGCDRKYPNKHSGTMLLVCTFIIFIHSGYRHISVNSITHNAPSQQAVQFFTLYNTEQYIISNYHIATLKHALPQHIILDNYYQASSLYKANSLSQRGFWQLSSTPLPQKPTATFNGRFTGERTLYLYYFVRSNQSPNALHNNHKKI